MLEGWGHLLDGRTVDAGRLSRSPPPAGGVADLAEHLAGVIVVEAEVLGDVHERVH